MAWGCLDSTKLTLISSSIKSNQTGYKTSAIHLKGSVKDTVKQNKKECVNKQVKASFTLLAGLKGTK